MSSNLENVRSLFGVIRSDTLKDAVAIVERLIIGADLEFGDLSELSIKE